MKSAACTTFSLNWGAAFTAARMSSPALASNTSQIASPRRKAAAPRGAFQVKSRATWSADLRAWATTQPLSGTGLGRTGAGVETGAGGGASAFLNRFTKPTPSA